MSYTYKLDSEKHDLVITNGKFARVNGADEVRQRIIVALQHYFEEYFINVPAGVPWYTKIMGSKGGSSTISNILRTKILRVPGVKQIIKFGVNYNGIDRSYVVSCDLVVQSGPGDIDTDVVIIDGLPVGAADS